jgi:hypothetical protein
MQGTLTGYERLVGLVCLVCAPMVLLFKKVRGAKPELAAH